MEGGGWNLYFFLMKRGTAASVHDEIVTRHGFVKKKKSSIFVAVVVIRRRHCVIGTWFVCGDEPYKFVNWQK